MKNDKTQKKPRKPGKLTIEDYKICSKNLGMQIDGLSEGTSMFDKLSATKERVDYLIQKLEKKLKEPPKKKDPIQWKCMQCGQVHTKRETVYQCSNCHSENIERFM